MLISLLSAKGAPGVTTTALALALCWHRPVLLAELDPAGGDVLAGYGQAQVAAGGLGELELAARHGELQRQLDAHLLRLDDTGRVRLLPGLTDPAGARHVNWARLAGALESVDDGETDVLADCGRLRTEHFPTEVVSRAAAAIVVTGSSLRALRSATQAVAQLKAELGDLNSRARTLAALVVRPGEPYGEREIAEALGVPVIGVLPRDGKAAAVLSDGTPAGRWFGQSALLRAARSTAPRLAEFAAGGPAGLALRSPESAERADRVGISRDR